ncbi:MAG: TonB-dependent receptor [Porticoccaceae bacterium]|nr:TonB-dependent receptor [Porticoccaceae bacterium]
MRQNRVNQGTGNHRWLIAFAAAFLAAINASAQDSAASSPRAQGGLEEIIVTAQRREASLQDVPIAVTAVSGDMANLLGFSEPQAIAEAIPSLTYNRNAASGTPFLRGVGTPSGVIGNEPSVATFIDDIYVNNGNPAVFDFNNIDQIEVLKGPQGTLFGRNATGGVIHIHTKNPSHEPEAKVSASYDDYDTAGFQFYGSAELTDTIAANIAAYSKDQNDGWGKNIIIGKDAYKRWAHGVRAKVLFEPSDATSLLFNASYDKSRGSQGLAGRVLAGTHSIAGYSPQGVGFYDTTVQDDDVYTADFTQVSVKLTHDWFAARFVSITSYSDVLSDSQFDTDASPVPFFYAFAAQKAKTYTQEFQLISPEDQDISWLLGAFLLHDESQFITTYQGSALTAIGGTGFGNAAQDTDSISAFAEMSAEIMPKTRLTLGLRYTQDEREFKGSTRSPTLNFPSVADDATFKEMTGRVSLDYRFTEDVLGYVSYNRGFKSGIFNLGGLSPGASSPPAAAEPEVLDAYAVGFKSELFDSRLRLNAEAYYYDYKDIQVATLVVGSQIITNAGAATIKGIDVDITAVPVDNLTITASINLADGKYTSFPGGPQNYPLAPNAPVPIPSRGCAASPPYPAANGVTPIAVDSCDLAGNDTVNTPSLATNLSLSYRFFAGDFPVDISGSWTHKDHYYFEADNNPGVKQPKTDIINASLKLNSPDERYGLVFWANNLTDKKYYNYITQSSISGIKYSPAAPRTYGVTFSAHFY